MPPISQSQLHQGALSRWLITWGGLLLIAAVIASCGGSSSVSTSGTGTVHVGLTDPPSCAFPNGPYEHAYVTIRSVQAHTNASAGDGAAGWQELAPQLNNQPMQIDLLGAGSNACLLATLGSNVVPAGTYQQFRLLLVSNDGSGGALPLTNQCAGHGFNCAILHDTTIHELRLSSQANTGLKIPPGQIVGGPITVMPEQSIDLNIDFNACGSIVVQGNGQYRLKPALTAGQVSTTNNNISGQVVDSATNLPLVGGTVLVALEQTDGAGTDVILQQAAADATGHFNFCPLPPGTIFDVVAVGIDGSGVAYNATIAVGVPGGTSLGIMPLTAETGPSTDPTRLQGFVTATTGSSSATIDSSVSALQTIMVNGAMRHVTIPAEGGSTPHISVESDTTCPAGAPVNANCAQYTLVEPASNPRVGIFSAGMITYAAPAGGDVPYSIRAHAQVPLSGGAPACLSPFLTTDLNSVGASLQAIAGATVEPARIDFSAC
jgi:Domain of unknown function (DUF4382)